MIWQKIRPFVGGVIFTIGTWMITVPVREFILKTSPIQNQIILGIIVVLVGLWVSGSIESGK